MAQRITLLTDFGTRDGYVAAMKAVISSICPNAIIDDASHEVAPGDVVQAALALRRYWKLYPPGSVHVAVVDPGVGTERRAVAASADDRMLIGPDNGVLGLALGAATRFNVVALTNRQYQRDAQSATFHGRDVFAPVAAYLACGVALQELGVAITDPVQLELPAPEIRESSVRGQVVYVDHFGNLITNIPAALLGTDPCVALNGRNVAVRDSYGHAGAGELLALVNSDGLLEIAVRDGSAAAELLAARGAAVDVRNEKKAGT